MRYTDLQGGEAADFWHECSKNLNNRVEVWQELAAKLFGIEFTEQDALRTRQQCRASEDRADRFHPMLRKDAPWF